LLVIGWSIQILDLWVWLGFLSFRSGAASWKPAAMLDSVQQLKNSMEFYRSAPDLGVTALGFIHPSPALLEEAFGGFHDASALSSPP